MLRAFQRLPRNYISLTVLMKQGNNLLPYADEAPDAVITLAMKSLVVSTHHPFADWQRHGGSYFATELVQDTWRRESRSFQMPFWRVSLTTLCDEFSQAGFFVDRLLEPQPVPEGEKIDPEGYHELMEQPGLSPFACANVKQFPVSAGPREKPWQPVCQACQRYHRQDWCPHPKYRGP